MSYSGTDVFSVKFKNFLENDFKQKLDNTNNFQLTTKKKFETRIIIACLTVFLFIIFLILCKTLLSNYLSPWLKNFLILADKYSLWYNNKAKIVKWILPSEPFSFNFFSVIISIFFLVIFLFFWTISILSQNMPKDGNLFRDFLIFYDPKLENLSYQKLLYSEVMKNNLTFDNYEYINLQDNINLNIDDFSLNIAQIRAGFFNNSDNNKLSILENIIKYRGIIISTKIEKKLNRSIKIFIGEIKNLDFSKLNFSEEFSLSDKNNIEIKIFSSDIKEIIYWKKNQELADFFNIIKEYIYKKPLYYDKFVKDLFNDNSRDDQINLKKFLEITINEENLTMIIPTGHNILYKESIFDNDPGINDCYLIANIIKIFRQLLKKPIITSVTEFNSPN